MNILGRPTRERIRRVRCFSIQPYTLILEDPHKPRVLFHTLGRTIASSYRAARTKGREQNVQLAESVRVRGWQLSSSTAAQGHYDRALARWARVRS